MSLGLGESEGVAGKDGDPSVAAVEQRLSRQGKKLPPLSGEPVAHSRHLGLSDPSFLQKDDVALFLSGELHECLPVPVQGVYVCVQYRKAHRGILSALARARSRVLRLTDANPSEPGAGGGSPLCPVAEGILAFLTARLNGLLVPFGPVLFPFLDRRGWAAKGGAVLRGDLIATHLSVAGSARVDGPDIRAATVVPVLPVEAWFLVHHVCAFPGRIGEGLPDDGPPPVEGLPGSGSSAW